MSGLDGWHLRTESRLTKVEVRLDGHEKAHSEIVVWQRAVTVVLLGIGLAIAHGSADGIVDLLTDVMVKLIGK